MLEQMQEQLRQCPYRVLIGGAGATLLHNKVDTSLYDPDDTTVFRQASMVLCLADHGRVPDEMLGSAIQALVRGQYVLVAADQRETMQRARLELLLRASLHHMLRVST